MSMFKLKDTISLKDLCDANDVQFQGQNINIEGVAPAQGAEPGCLTFTGDLSEGVTGQAIVTSSITDQATLESNGVIVSSKPRFCFVKLLTYLVNSVGFEKENRPPVIADSAQIGPNVVIENDCVIEDDVVIEANVVIHWGTHIGKGSRIRSGATVGGDGFGFEREADGTPIRFPHLGRAIIGNYVEVGSNTTVARGTLGNTTIEDHAKVDNLVHVGHNVTIKRGALVTACAELSGGVIVGENAWVAPNSCTHQKIIIGKNSMVGLGAVVVKDVPESTVYAGNPARKLRDLS